MDNSTAISNMDTSTSQSFPLSPAAIVLPLLTLMTLIVDLPPLVWHIRGRNLAASTLIGYIMLDNLMNMINPLIWPTDDINNWWPGFGLCDVEIKLMTGTWIGVVACLVCMLRDLARVLDTDRTVLSLSKAEQRRKLIVDCLLCFGAPIYLIGAHFIVQSNRYYIFAISGCNGGFDPSWPSLVLIYIWPPALCIVNLYLAGLIIFRIIRYQKTFSEILASSSSAGLTKNRFFRLFLMAFTMIIVITPVTFFIFYENVISTVIPFSWSRVHGPDSWKITLVPTYGQVNFDRWIQAGSGFVVFFFFGMGQDAVKGYKKGLLRIGFGRMFPSLRQESTHDGSFGSQETFASRTRLISERTNRQSRKLGFSLSTFSPKSLSSSSSHSPTLTSARPANGTSIAELEAGPSASTAPSTPYSNQKFPVPNNAPKINWLQKCLMSWRVTRSAGNPRFDSDAAETGQRVHMEKF